VVDPGLYAAASAILASRSPLRGRHGNAGNVRNILGGLATCPNCGSIMTLVVKGKRSQPKLVCTKAKAGAGCPYQSVAYGNVERALVRQADRLVGEALSNGEALARADELETEMWAKQDELERMIDAVASGALANDPTVATRIARPRRNTQSCAGTWPARCSRPLRPVAPWSPSASPSCTRPSRPNPSIASGLTPCSASC
jgi:hypothetical protein